MSKAIERRIQCYPKTFLFRKVKRQSENENRSKSSILEEALYEYYKNKK